MTLLIWSSRGNRQCIFIVSCLVRVFLLLTIVVWSLKIAVTHLSPGPQGRFCCATDAGVIHVFSGSSPCPIETLNLGRKAFGMTLLDDGSIAYLDKDFIFTRLDSQTVVSKPAAIVKPKQSIFGSIYGTQTEKVAVKKVSSIQDSRKIKTGLFDSSSHIIPTPSKLNKTFLESMLEGAVVY